MAASISEPGHSIGRPANQPAESCASMTTLGLIAEPAARTEPQRVTTIRDPAVGSAISRVNSIHDEQIQALVQQLFLRESPEPVRHVGFSAVETQTETAQLCLDVATALAATGSCD